MVNAYANMEMQKTDETVLTKAETAERIAFNSMLPIRNHVNRSKPTSEENDVRTPAADVEGPITEDALKKWHREDDANIQTERELLQTNGKNANRFMMKQWKAPYLGSTRKPKQNPARKPSTKSTIMTSQRNVAQFMPRFCGCNATQLTEKNRSKGRRG